MTLFACPIATSAATCRSRCESSASGAVAGSLRRARGSARRTTRNSRRATSARPRVLPMWPPRDADPRAIAAARGRPRRRTVGASRAQSSTSPLPGDRPGLRSGAGRLPAWPVACGAGSPPRCAGRSGPARAGSPGLAVGTSSAGRRRGCILGPTGSDHCCRTCPRCPSHGVSCAASPARRTTDRDRVPRRPRRTWRARGPDASRSRRRGRRSTRRRVGDRSSPSTANRTSGLPDPIRRRHERKSRT